MSVHLTPTVGIPNDENFAICLLLKAIRLQGTSEEIHQHDSVIFTDIIIREFAI